jgi:Nop14-like family.
MNHLLVLKRTEIPYVFEVPTTLEALHDMIATYATTGTDASLIIERIHTSNSVRLDHRNKEKMQNYYDVLLRRFIGVGDALYKGGNGGEDLGRYDQLDSLTKTLYDMAQDAPDSAAAVWGGDLEYFKMLTPSDFEIQNLSQLTTIMSFLPGLQVGLFYYCEHLDIFSP